jgi:hypothetical protein
MAKKKSKIDAKKQEEMSNALNPPTREECVAYSVHMDPDQICAECAALDWNPNGKGNWAFCAVHGKFIAHMFPDCRDLGMSNCNQWFR